MKLQPMDKEYSMLVVRHKRCNKEIKVRNSDLVKFFPFNNLYQYYVNEEGDRLIFRRYAGVSNTSYGVDDTSADVIEDNKTCRLENMTNPVVEQENVALIAQAKEWGIPTLVDKDFTEKDIQQGFYKLGDILDMYSSIITERYKEAVNNPFFDDKQRIQQTRIALHKDSNKSFEDEYKFIGSLYTMLNYMRKMVRRNQYVR